MARPLAPYFLEDASRYRRVPNRVLSSLPAVSRDLALRERNGVDVDRQKRLREPGRLGRHHSHGGHPLSTVRPNYRTAAVDFLSLRGAAEHSNGSLPPVAAG